VSATTARQKQAFLDALADGKTVIDAAKTAGRGRATFYRLKDEDPDFAKLWAVAYEEGTDRLEAEAERRAVDGVEDFRVAGKEIIPVRKYSDTLLIFLLKARRPEKFRDNVKVEHTGDGGGPIEIEHRGVKLSDIVRVAREAGVELGD